ncbi:hypothetical protein BGZ46_009421 [Entomortierella lignicola]|nr:hypothetical protein BGZ46_009421 [Entomortierella lignicola]
MLSNSSICTRTDLLKDGFKSFPSGHSSFSFGGLGYLSMFIAGKLHLFDERGHIYKSIVVLAPLILAALIAISRVDNYRHHWQDVTVGSFIGIVFAVFSYRQYYPSLAAAKCGNPFTPRGADALVSTLLPLRNDPDDDDTPDHIAHRQAFLNNPDQGSSMYRNSTADTLISTPNVHGGNNIYKNSSYNMDSQNGQRNNNGR